MLRAIPASFLLLLLSAAGCGYHTVVSSASHLPAGIKTVGLPMFANQTQTPRLETWMTQAVARELASRAGVAVTTTSVNDADAVLHGTIVAETVTPLLYNSSSSQTTTASYEITVQARIVLKDRSGHVLFENDRYQFRENYESTEQLSSFIEEDTPARQRLARAFAQAVVADIMESF